MHVNIVDAAVKGVLIVLFMAISVGPTLFAVIKYSLNYSYKAGLAFILGVSVSDLLFVTVSNLAASWLENLKPYERHIAFGGAVVLMAMGIHGLIRKLKPKRPSATPLEVTGGQYLKIWVSGFLVNTLNPGALVTWLGAVTLIANTSGFYRFILFGVALIIILTIDFSKVFLADRIKRLLTIRRIIYVQRFSAACLLLIGLSLFVSTTFSLQFSKNKEKGGIENILSK